MQVAPEASTVPYRRRPCSRTTGTSQFRALPLKRLRGLRRTPGGDIVNCRLPVRSVLMCSLICLTVSQLALGQTSGSIAGEVRDVTGGAASGVDITATNEGTGATRSATTNEAGVYSFPSLAPGTYTLQAGRPGFKTAVRRQIELHVQQAARIDIALEVGEVIESVQVMADAALLATENGTVGTVIENKRIVELPLNGRNYLQLVSLSPNVSTG